MRMPSWLPWRYMNRELSQAPELLSVVSWNILLDKTRQAYDRSDPRFIPPQNERAIKLAKTLGTLLDRESIQPDIIALQEVEKNDDRRYHSGLTISRELGFDNSYWIEHNKKLYDTAKRGRKGEHIGLFGNHVTGVEYINLGDNRRAAVCVLGDIAVATVHFRREKFWGPKRLEQAGVLLDRLADYEKAVVMGDFNAHPFEAARKIFIQHNFRSAYHMIHGKYPATYPAPQYAGAIMHRWQEKIARDRIMLDDIYVRGLGSVAAGRFSGHSDHYGLWATLTT